ncbi:GFA family protein (plasmid) [Sphingomonas bisphenolicum]
MSGPLSHGRCLCGQVRYSFTGAPLLTAVCHCRHCQRQGASAFSVVVAVPADSFTQQGETKVFADTGDSGQAVARHFCPTCGSPIASIADALPGLVLIKAGTLDDFDRHVPVMEVYCDNRVPWLPTMPDAQQFPGSNIGVE